jgi:hypothetical protein
VCAVDTHQVSGPAESGQTSGVIISDPQLTWLYHPYDDGADVIAANTRDRDDLRERHASWLSQHRAGL